MGRFSIVTTVFICVNVFLSMSYDCSCCSIELEPTYFHFLSVWLVSVEAMALILLLLNARRGQILVGVCVVRRDDAKVGGPTLSI